MLGSVNRLLSLYYSRLVGVIVIICCASKCLGNTCDLSQTPYCTWAGSSLGFIAPGDSISLINFETLPNGSPSFGGANITPAFNYVLQGALFGSPFPSLKVVGNTQIGFALEAHTSSPIAHNWITAQLTQPERGIGVRTIGHTTLSAYDSEGTLIASVFHNSGISYFLGIRSNIPIARVVIDDFTNSIAIDDFTMIHIPVPEPASAALLLLVAPVHFRRSWRRCRV